MYALYQSVPVGLLFVSVQSKIETLGFGIEAKQPKQIVLKQTETNWKTLNLLEKIPKFAPYQTVSVVLLFVSVQLKHQNALFQ